MSWPLWKVLWKYTNTSFQTCSQELKRWILRNKEGLKPVPEENPNVNDTVANHSPTFADGPKSEQVKAAAPRYQTWAA